MLHPSEEFELRANSLGAYMKVTESSLGKLKFSFKFFSVENDKHIQAN